MYFTSESVSEGHPDKMADQMSDAVLDAILIQDPKGRVACDILVKNNTVILAGEITSSASIEADSIIRHVANEIGYVNPSLGFDATSCQIISLLSKQSIDIANAIDHINPKEQGAGDQGTLFGYACDETEVLMPAPIFYAHRLMERQAYLRKSGKIQWIGPDAKSQVTLRYVKNYPVEVMSIVFSTQHDEGIPPLFLREMVLEEIIQPIIPKNWLTTNTRYFINPGGRFVIGGPACDCGLTGRKIAVDSYGGFARDGGGCFSGKDPSKVDRSGAYMARYIAKNFVAAGLAKRCEVQISYAIGLSEPVAVNVETFGTGTISDALLREKILNTWDLCPFSIIQFLKLERPLYFKTASYGHFGRSGFPWEQIEPL